MKNGHSRICLLLTVLALCISLFMGSCSYVNYDEKEPADEVFAYTELETDKPETKAPATSSPEEVTSAPETTVPETTAEETEPETTEPVPVETQPPVPGYVGVTGMTLSFYVANIPAGETQMPYVTMLPANATDKGEKWESSDTSVAVVDIYGNITGISQGKCTVTVTSTDNPAISASVAVMVSPGVELTYIDGILIANKTYPLPKSYAPGWNTEGAAQLSVMFAAAQAEGIYLKMQSGYRSYIDQSIIYNDYVARDGQEAADRYSARPGHSEHQTGLAFDLTTTYYDGLWEGFADTPEGKWVAENCHKYGFIIRYPKEKEHITGYMYEPWHVRYIGVDKATAVYESGLCLEEYLNITSSYAN